ncbi:MAG: hypothetical protein WD030_05580 [Pirellulales bacterium]
MTRYLACGLSLSLAMTVTSLGANPYGAPSTLPYTSTPYADGRGGNYYAAYSPDAEQVEPGIAEPVSPSDDAPPVYQPEPYSANNAWDSYGCADGSCNDACRTGCGTCCGPWYARASALYMTRDDANRFWFAADGANPVDQVLNNRDAEWDWEGGWEVSLGRCLSDCTVLEFTYWELGGFNGYANVTDAGDNLLSTLDFGNVEFGGIDAALFFDGVGEQRLWRTSEVRNLELNLWHVPVDTGCGAFKTSLLAGVRYFNFDNGIRYGSVRSGSNFGDNGGADEAYLSVDINNHLIGFQIGADLEYGIGGGLSVFARPKAGFYANYMEKSSNLATGAGVEADTAFGDVYPFDGSKTDVSFIFEIETGARWQMSQCWSVYASYRAMSVAGIGIADQNIPFYMAGAADFREVWSNGDLIVHGGTLGLEYNW